jgi:hypothetical protein
MAIMKLNDHQGSLIREFALAAAALLGLRVSKILEPGAEAQVIRSHAPLADAALGMEDVHAIRYGPAVEHLPTDEVDGASQGIWVP